MATSSAEAELIAGNRAAAGSLGVQAVAKDLGRASSKSPRGKAKAKREIGESGTGKVGQRHLKNPEQEPSLCVRAFRDAIRVRKVAHGRREASVNVRPRSSPRSTTRTLRQVML